MVYGGDLCFWNASLFFNDAQAINNSEYAFVDQAILFKMSQKVRKLFMLYWTKNTFPIFLYNCKRDHIKKFYWSSHIVFTFTFSSVSQGPKSFGEPVIPSDHYNGVIMGAIASQITSLTIIYSTVYSEADQRKYQSSASLAFVRGN